jgi:glycosyltransferase involved in cell wall biosynthesis
MTSPLKILFLANWPMRAKGSGGDYAFFAQWKRRPDVTLMGTGDLGFITAFEKHRLRFYLLAPLAAFFRSFFYDCVIAYSSQVGLPLALLFRIFFRKKTRLIVFDVESFGRVRSGVNLSLLRFAAARIDRVVYASSRQMEYYKRTLPFLADRCRYIPIGIGPYDKEKPIGGPADGPIVAPGHHDKSFRDWATLLRAYGPLSGRSGLLIAGRDGLPPEDREGVPVPAGCAFQPFVPIREFQKQIESAPFVVLPLPEREQSLGQLTVLFCMAMGKAVIGTRVMGIEDYVDDGVTGILVPPRDPDALRKAMARLLDNPEEAARMGAEGHRRLQERFTDRIMGGAWEDLITEIAGRD